MDMNPLSFWKKVASVLSPSNGSDDVTTSGTVTAGTFTDDTLSISSGSITSAVDGTFSGTVTAATRFSGGGFMLTVGVDPWSLDCGFQATFLNTSGTVTGEQVTSTDDMTMEGHLLTLGDNTSADDVVISFLSSGNDASITYDQTDDEFDYGDAAITTTGTGTFGEVVVDDLNINGSSILAGSGASGILTIGGAGGARNENLTFDFEGSNNQVGLSSTTNAALAMEVNQRFFDNKQFSFGTSNDTLFTWNTYGGNDYMAVGVKFSGTSTQSGNFALMEAADVGQANRSPGIESDPTFLVWSADASSSTEYLRVQYNSITSGTGAIDFDDEELTTTGAVNRDGWFQGYSATAQTGLTGAATTINFDAETHKDASHYTHSTVANPQNITIDTTGTYKISYSVNWDNDLTDRTTTRAWVEDDGSEIIPSKSYCYIRYNTYGRFGTNTATFIADITAASVVTLACDAQKGTGAFGSNCDNDTIADECWITIEKVS